MFLASSINLANAKTWSNCKLIDRDVLRYKPTNWGNTGQANNNFKSWFPNSFNFTDKDVNFFGKKVKYYSANRGKYAAVLTISTNGTPARIYIDTSNTLKFKLSWSGNYSGATGWINIACNERVKPTKEVKNIIDYSNKKEFGLLGTWNGKLKCSNKVYDFSAFVEGKKAQINTAGVNYKGELRFNNDKTTAKFFGAGDNGKAVTEVISISNDFKVIKGKMSSGCSFNAESQRVKVYGKNNKYQKTARNKKILCDNEVSDVALNSTVFKTMQRSLKTLGYYKSEIDGKFGKGSCKALRAYLVKETKGSYKSFTLSKFNQLNDDANRVIRLAKKDNSKKEDALVCDKATILQNGIRRWNLEQPKFINLVKSRGLDCKITVDNTPFTQKEAKYFLLQLTDFVSNNSSKFDLNFSSEFNKVRNIITGEWNVPLSKEFELFRVYVSKFEDFQKYLEDIRLAEKGAEKKRIEQIRESISQNMAILKEWAQKNILDEKSAQIATLESQIGMKGNQSINSLEQLLDDAQRLLAATGINDSTDGNTSELASTACIKTDLTQCSDNLICETATIISDGIRRWNFDQPKFIQQVKSRGLDCKITIDTSPFNQQEAKYFLSQLKTFVSENPSEFGLSFAAEFNKVRGITSGKWNSNLSKTFELFRSYTSEFPLFQKYLEDIRLAEVEAKQVRLEKLRETAVQDMIVLREWAQKNVLDEKAAQIALLDAQFGDKNIQTINGLEQLIAETKRLFSATGIKDTVAQKQMNEIVSSLYNPSSIYLFANVSGDAANIYKNLDGEFSFEQAEGTYCASNKLDAFDYYVLQGKIFTTFNDLSKLTSRCSASADVFVVKGNEITSDTVFNVIKLDKLQQVLEVPKSERDAAFNQLNFLKETIKKDVIAGDRVGYGLIKTDTKDTSICAVIDGSEQGHVNQLEQSASLLKSLSYPWNGFNKITNNAEEAFKSLQRGQCSSVYGSALTLGRLYLAGESAGINMEFMPVWVSKSAVEASQKSYDATLADSANANAKLAQSIKDKEKLDEQAKQSKAELASVRQLDLREKNGLRFMVLRDELQAQVFSAVKFAFENPADEAGYIKKYLSQSFVDQSTRYSSFDGIISDIQKLAAERWEITEQRIEQVDYGKAKFNGRELDAIEVELRIASKNRLVGKYSEYCQRIHVIKDDDFEMWRNFEIVNCEVTSATRKWKNASSFESLWIVEAK